MSIDQKKYYFLSDFHLGIPDNKSSREREIILINWFNEVKTDAKEIYILGDIFDFWFEYSKVVPKGYVRFLAKLAELIESGVKIHVFHGNHDLWEFKYLRDEIGVIYHRKPETIECNGKKIHLAHGDGLGPDDIFYKLLLRIFEGKFNQFLFKWIHPDLGIRFALSLSNKHRYIKRHERGKDIQINLDNELLYKYALEKNKDNTEIDYFIFGHRHIPIIADIPDSKAKFALLGDWMTHYTYCIVDESGNLTLNKFIS
ncbi:UDP-2,3-diacylglucosamine diphosphatase [Bacteroidales bacterium OttesenSCG-928-K03]|nr:UDP-2,3-diacylglucosamine diphosphatase [Odoribacter sp. OttesenSCG-928-L07]MDL2239367.1 UDP-2,3-diacylglucosamine diphosphatase [Bacteroidales bacterium OttesenSCG-928-L14]MDL2240582.1 UDP-2,3-diacylglucosamine diphosphatase [Bacteroidales bacterium OttesenSCG-928-K22]MDL2242357.1 UDP-2,3-diacylglucosamine diphosphatase [Bacteroidales bacterium OttesenSCG-928-K03]